MTKKLFYLPLLVATIAVVAACSKLDELTSDYFTVTPQVLEAVGGQVPATITGTFPAKYFKKKAVVKITPVLKWDGGEARAESTTYQGEKVEGNAITVPYTEGGTYTMKVSFDYVPEMITSELYLEFDATVGSKAVDLPSIKIADGVISTSELVDATVATASTAEAKDAFQRIIAEKHEAQIMFLIQQANVRSSELSAAKDFESKVKTINDTDRREITSIEISAYASPDGSLSLNQGLAENRQDNTAKVINKNLKKDKIEANVDTKYTAEDWEGFQELVAASNIQDKELILRVLSMYQDPEKREEEIKNISSVYSTLADEILPQLRRSRLTLNYNVIGKTDEEITAAFASDPSSLTLEELLYAATLTDDAAQKEKIYKKTTDLYPNDYRAYCNLGVLAYQAGDYDKAESYLKKAASIESAPEVNLNLGLVALAQGDTDAAEAYLAKASGAEGLDEALGNLYIAQGQYAKAVAAFGDTKSNSAALAQILAEDYNKAKTTLDAVSPADGYTYYLKAVIGARTNNSSTVISNLKTAVAQDSSLKARAAADLEFAAYADNADFQAIVK